ncbi:MAG: DUF2520 domain-containing protein, partial [Bacteroidota bacterium]
NLAWHLVPNLQQIGLSVDIWSRLAEKSRTVEKWTAPMQSWPLYSTETPSATELAAIFLAIPDDYITEISQRLATLFPPEIPIIHTSGATSTDRITNHFTKRAALWPIRSLRKVEYVPNWQDLPLAYYCTEPDFETTLAVWAGTLSKLTYRLDDEQRAQLHLAAVFSNNFTTWLCQIAYELCMEHEIPFSALVPIIKNTFSKIDATEPALRQTGAAIRGDMATMERHEDLLKNHLEYAELYRMMSQLIMGYK